MTGRLRTLHVGYGRYISYTLATTFVTFGYILPTLVSLGRYRRYTFCYRRYNSACSIITATRSPDVSSRGGSKPNGSDCVSVWEWKLPGGVRDLTKTRPRGFRDASPSCPRRVLVGSWSCPFPVPSRTCPVQDMSPTGPLRVLFYRYLRPMRWRSCPSWRRGGIRRTPAAWLIVTRVTEVDVLGSSPVSRVTDGSRWSP